MRGLTLMLVVAALAAAPASAETRETSPTPTGRIAYAPRFNPKEIFTVSAAGGRSMNLTRHPCS